MGVILGTQYTIPNPPAIWTGLEMKWIGTDGTEWSLSDASSGTVMMPGVRGLSMPPLVHHRAAHASVPGARWRGLHVDVREVFWPLQVYTGSGSQDWVEKDRAFWRSLDPQDTGTWVVVLPDGRTRSLRLRYTSDSDFTFDHDSVMDGWAVYGITLSAEQPFWEGEAITKSWAGSSVSETGFFPAGGGPGFNISPSRTLNTASLTNPGDVDAYLVWQIHGPVNEATVGVNGKTISIPFSVPSGQVLQIDTNPNAQTAMQGSTDKTGQLTNITFAPLPAAKRSNLTLSVDGAGSISASFVPRYYRAW
jgi:hypothetical protein